MASFLPSSFQKKLLRYALVRTGFLDTDTLDLESLDINLGKLNKVELRNVGLDVKKLTSLLKLPEELQIVTARILLLRLIVPADLYRSAIVAEIDGIEVKLTLGAKEPAADTVDNARRRPESTKSPPHRKTGRRLRSPQPYDPGGRYDGTKQEGYVPNTQDLAKSFLQEEPLEEKRELEAIYTSQSRRLDESTFSDGSEGSAFGTGTGLGLPGFLANFLQGIVDRIEVRINNVRAYLEIDLPAQEAPIANRSDDDLITLMLSVDSLDIDGVVSVSGLKADKRSPEIPPLGSSSTEDKDQGSKRRVSIRGVQLDLSGAAGRFEDLTQTPFRTSPLSSTRARSPVTKIDDPTTPTAVSPGRQSSASTSSIPASLLKECDSSSSSTVPFALPRQISNLARDLNRTSTASDGNRYVETGDPVTQPLDNSTDSLDIKPGEDNVSWANRLSQTGHHREASWTSSDEPSDLSESVLADETLAASDSRAYMGSSAASTALKEPSDLSPDFDGLLEQSTFLSSLGQALNEVQEEPRDVSSIQDDSRSSAQSVGECASRQGNDMGSTGQSTQSLDSQTAEEIGQELSESRLYSQEEAESMYMSAVTAHSIQSPEWKPVPGHWGTEDSIMALDPSTETGPARDSGHRPDPSIEDTTSTPRPSSPLNEFLPQGAATPTLNAASEQSVKPRSDLDTRQVQKQVFSINQITLWLPGAPAETHEDEGQSSDVLPPLSQPRRSSSNPSRGQYMPGAFSQYAEQTASVRFDASYMYETTGSLAKPLSKTSKSERVDVSIGIFQLLGDMTILRLMYQLMHAAKQLLTSPLDQAKPLKAASPPSALYTVNLFVGSLHVAFYEHLAAKSIAGAAAQDEGIPGQPLLQVKLEDMRAKLMLDGSPSVVTVDISRFAIALVGKDVVSFSENLSTQSFVQAKRASDISVEITHGLTTIANKAVTQIGLNTRCINIDVDLQEIDAALSSFGGLSGVLELSSSIMSSPSSGQKSPTLTPKKGVHFHEQDRSHESESETKINARIGGLAARLSGIESSISVNTSALKFVVRQDYIAASIDAVSYTGPCPKIAIVDSAVTVSLNNTRIEYFFTPKDIDLERLLSILIPSKNKYENDEDIIVDTLLRQRRKGAVLRLNVGSVRGDVSSWEFLDRLQVLGQEFAKLSAVTKYLPEDDKPGLLILPRIQDLRLQLPVNNRFGFIDVHCKDVQAAHIGIPSLLAIAVGTIRAGPPGGQDLVHELMPVAAAEDLPMFMARMIGDEVEPTFKVKLFNFCAEYSVPTIVALTGLDAEAKAEEVVDVAASVMVDFVEAAADRAILAPSIGSESPTKPPKKLSIDVLFHDCAVGLKPLNHTAKALFVLKDSHFSTIVPPGDVFEASLELRKAALHITDDDVITGGNDLEGSGSQPLSVRLLHTLSAGGFVSISSIMAARIAFHITQEIGTPTRYIDVEFRDELFVLESCADSTQTLIQILNGLSPPTPPSTEPKFRTEAMTMEDMMSSFSGDAFEKPRPAASTLFDADLEETELPDDLLSETDLSESLYGLGSEMADPEADALPSEMDQGDIAESLLDDDPFEMPLSPMSQKLDDVELLRSLKDQRPPTTDQVPVELKRHLLTSKQLDRIPGATSVLGAPNRWNTPNVDFPAHTAPTSKDQLPFRLRIRNVHIIFNLYDGYDWQRTRNTITDAVEEIEAKAEERKMNRRRSREVDEDDESVIGDCLFNSIYIGVPANRDPQELRRQINRGINDLASETDSYATSGQTRPSNVSGGQQYRAKSKTRRLKLERSKTHKISFELKGVSADVLVFPTGVAETQNSVDLRIKDLEIFDNLSTSTWRKFITAMSDVKETREMAKPMIHLELQNVRPVLELAATELVMRVTILPLRAHIDQDALDFMTRFFQFKDKSASVSDSGGDQPFIQRLDINTVDLLLDYKPKKVDYAGLRSGKATEYMNFVILDRAPIKLRHAIVYGIRGFDALHPTLNDIWMPDVRGNQIPRILSGLAPISSLVTIMTGFYDIAAVPVQEYKKDGRLVRSVQKGAVHFFRNTTSEIARFGAKMAVGTQTVLQGAETMLSPGLAGPPDRHRRVTEQGWTDVHSDDEREPRAISAYADQPLGVLQGLKSARRQLEHDLLTARDAFIAVQGEVLESGSAVGAAQAVARRAPTIMLRPMIGATRAAGQTLMGIGNQVDRANVKRVEDKYKRH